MLPSSGLNGGSIVQVTAYQLPFTAKTSAGMLWLVDGMKVLPDEVSRLERFRGGSVAGGRREETPGTLSRGNRGRWEAEKDTWNTFAGIPWQVGSRERTPGTLSREFCVRCVPHLQGHTVALRRSFPQCGPLPFSGADAGFGLCMSLSSRMILPP